MNIGIYIPDMGNGQIVSQCVAELDRGINNRLIKTASVFFDNMGPINEHLNFGIFNSTDLWNFSGKLFALTQDCALKAANTVNDIEIFFGYGWDKESNLFAILDLVYAKKLKAICRTEELAQEFYRITGHKPVGCSENLQNLIEIMVNQ